jgi:putative oxidoreductase
LVFHHSLRLAKSQAHCPTNLAQNDSSKSGRICLVPELRHWNSRLNQFTIAAMKFLTIIARVLLGLVFVVFGSNAFLHFLPMPPLPQGLAGEYLHAFFASGYVYVIGGMQLVGGLLLLIGRFVPLGLTILAAIIFNIWVFHILMAPEGFPPALVVTLLELFLLWRYRDSFAGLLRA